jgi:hypothetical protein
MKYLILALMIINTACGSSPADPLKASIYYISWDCSQYSGPEQQIECGKIMKVEKGTAGPMKLGDCEVFIQNAGGVLFLQMGSNDLTLSCVKN